MDRSRGARARVPAFALLTGTPAGYVTEGHPWPGGVIRYYNAAPDQAWAVKRAVDAWNSSGARIQLVAAPASQAAVRIEHFPHVGCTINAEATVGYTRTARIWIFQLDNASPYCNAYQAAESLAHEFGHVLGLGHETRGCSAMNPVGTLQGPELCPKAQRWQWRCRLLTSDDIAGAVDLYGGEAAPPTGPSNCSLYRGIGMPTGLRVATTAVSHRFRISFRRPSSAAVPAFLTSQMAQTESFVVASSSSLSDRRAQVPAAGLGCRTRRHTADLSHAADRRHLRQRVGGRLVRPALGPAGDAPGPGRRDRLTRVVPGLRLELARRREPVEDLSRLPEHARHEVLERPRTLEAADADRLVAGVADQLLGHLAGVVVCGVEAARPDALLRDPVVQRGEVRVERLRDRPVRVRLDLVGERLVLLVAALERICGVDRDLPSSPVTFASASEIEPDGTATRTTSASAAEPPSRPSVVTSWPARSHRRASPPPMFPLPIVVIFTVRASRRRPHPAL